MKNRIHTLQTSDFLAFVSYRQKTDKKNVFHLIFLFKPCIKAVPAFDTLNYLLSTIFPPNFNLLSQVGPEILAFEKRLGRAGSGRAGSGRVTLLMDFT